MSGADVIRRAGSSPQIDAILRILDDMATPGSQRVAKEVAQDNAWIAQGAKQSGSDAVATVANAASGFSTALGPIRALLGLKRADGSAYPWYARWGARFGLVGIAALGLRWYFAPQYHAVRAAWSAGKPVKQIEDKAEAA